MVRKFTIRRLLGDCMFAILASPGALRVHILNVSSIRLFWDPPQLFIVDFKHYFLKYALLLVSV